MHSEVSVALSPQQEFRFDLEGQEPLSNEAARRWLDEQFTQLECEPLRASGKVLLADKLVVVAREARNRPELFESADWRNDYAVAAQAVLSKPLIRVDVPAMSISY